MIILPLSSPPIVHCLASLRGWGPLGESPLGLSVRAEECTHVYTRVYTRVHKSVHVGTQRPSRDTLKYRGIEHASVPSAKGFQWGDNILSPRGIIYSPPLLTFLSERVIAESGSGQ